MMKCAVCIHINTCRHMTSKRDGADDNSQDLPPHRELLERERLRSKGVGCRRASNASRERERKSLAWMTELPSLANGNYHIHLCKISHARSAFTLRSRPFFNRVFLLKAYTDCICKSICFTAPPHFSPKLSMKLTYIY